MEDGNAAHTTHLGHQVNYYGEPSSLQSKSASLFQAKWPTSSCPLHEGPLGIKQMTHDRQ